MNKTMGLVWASVLAMSVSQALAAEPMMLPAARARSDNYANETAYKYYYYVAIPAGTKIARYRQYDRTYSSWRLDVVQGGVLNTFNFVNYKGYPEIEVYKSLETLRESEPFTLMVMCNSSLATYSTSGTLGGVSYTQWRVHVITNMEGSQCLPYVINTGG